MKEKSVLVAMLLQILVLKSFLAPCFASETQGINATYGKGEQSICVATGSPGSLGLLKALAEPFCRIHQCRVHWMNMGSGESLEALKAGKADMIMVHAPEAEKKAVVEGWATVRTLLGCNEFYVLGPESDPAGIRQAKSAAEAYAMIAKKQSRFFSRGDNSGTHKKEMMIWEMSRIKPTGPWHIITKDFMGPTLMRADHEQGYFMVDSSTYIAKRSKVKNLKVLFKGDPVLVNVYYGLIGSPERHPQANYELAAKFLAFLRSSEGQKIYREYGKDQFGTALYDDAEKAEKWDK